MYIISMGSPHLGIGVSRQLFARGGSEPFAQKFSQVSHIFMRQSERNEGHMMQ